MVGDGCWWVLGGGGGAGGLRAAQRDVDAVPRRRELPQVLAGRLVAERQRHARGVQQLAAAGELEPVPVRRHALAHGAPRWRFKYEYLVRCKRS